MQPLCTANLTLPDGRIYSALLRSHHTLGREWFEGFLACADRESTARDELLNADVGPFPFPTVRFGQSARYQFVERRELQLMLPE